MLQGLLGQNREPPPPQIPSSSRPPGRRAAILGKVTTGAARGCVAALQKPEKVLGRRRPPNFSWFSRTLYFNLLSLHVVVVGRLTKYERYKILK